MSKTNLHRGKLASLWKRIFNRPQLPLGTLGELAAARFLRRRRYRIVARGHRMSLGELDLVAVDGRTVVFVEVKTRTSHAAGHPVEAVDGEKQRRLTRSALAFLKKHDLLDCRARFDVMAVTWPDRNRKPEIVHFKNAFEASDQGPMFT